MNTIKPSAIHLAIFITLLFLVLRYVFSLQVDGSQQLDVIFCDVGQGDATLVQLGTWQVLIDGGVDASVLSCLDDFMPYMDQTIEVVILTHAHSDHFNGLTLVMEKYRTPLIMTNGLTAETADFTAFSEAVRKQLRDGSQHVVVGEGARFSVNDVLHIDILAPAQTFGTMKIETETQLWDTNAAASPVIEDQNEPSIAAFFTFDKFGFLVTGDMYEEGELALTKYRMITHTTLLKAGHHGSKTSSSLPFLMATAPEVVIISAGRNNRHGHPAPEVLERINLIGAQVARTDLEGTLRFVTDGKQLFRTSTAADL